MTSHITITGVTGFVGSVLAERARKRGYTVRGVCRHPTNAIQQQGIELVTVSSYLDVPPSPRGGGALIHLAEQSTLTPSVDAVDAPAVVRQLAALGYDWMGYASSAAVYGDKAAVPHDVTDPTDDQIGYTRSKLACENIALSADGTVLRFTNLYGNRQKSNTVIGRILSQVYTERPLVLGNTQPIRDFCWVEDAADAILDLLAKNRRHIYNVGSGVGTSIGDLARLALRTAGRGSVKILSESTPNPTVSALVVNILKTTQDCAWVPKTTLEMGLARAMKDYR